MLADYKIWFQAAHAIIILTDCLFKIFNTLTLKDYDHCSRRLRCKQRKWSDNLYVTCMFFVVTRKERTAMQQLSLWIYLKFCQSPPSSYRLVCNAMMSGWWSDHNSDSHYCEPSPSSLLTVFFHTSERIT